MIEFFEYLIKSSVRKIFLILDNLRVHHFYIVKEWLTQESIKQKMEVFWLPSYSSELNSHEYLNCDLKRGLSDLPAPKNVANLMNMLQQNEARVAKYFTHAAIQYAA